jgi:hypothetical protein
MYGYGNSLYLTANKILASANAGNPPVNTVAPAITGTAQEGQIVTCSTGTWTGTPTITYAYQWKRNGSNIGSATNSTYTLVTADVSQSITCQVTATNGSGSASATSNTITPISAFTGLLDTYPNAAVGYSLRKLRTAYTGAAIRVRRSSDNAEQDINFVGGDLDTSSLLTFCGAGNGFITTWYDQSGNGLNLTMTVAANQPRIVNAGVIETKGSENAIKFDGSNDYMTRTSLTALNSGNNYSYFTISSNDLISNPNTVFTTSVVNSRLENFIDTRTTGGAYRNMLIQNTSALAYNADLSAANGSTNQRLLSGFVNGFSMSAFNNGNTGGTATYTGSYTNNLFEIGANRGFTRYLNGYIQELIIYPTDQSLNRVGIESNINTYYTIF